MAAATDIENVPMFCFQCEQTAKAEACTIRGVCTKDAQLAGLEDHLMWGLQSLAVHAQVALDGNIPLPENLYMFMAKALFSTLTNVNFSCDDIVSFIRECVEFRDLIKSSNPTPVQPLPGETFYSGNCGSLLNHTAVATWVPGATMADMIAEARAFLISKRFARLGKDRVCLQELLMYGLKGIAAYYYHSQVLGLQNEDIGKFSIKALAFVHKEDPSVDELLGMCLECGKVNFATMELLDKANTSHYGNPEPTKVLWAKTPQCAKEGKAILVSGHDLWELEEILKHTQGKGINVWTHGEMLPCNAYPLLKKFPHLVGHYGTAWQNQKREFEVFPGPIFMTTNCYIPAPRTYVNRVFASTPVGGVDVKKRENFDAMIQCALEMPGFQAPTEPLGYLTIGFGHNATLGAAGTVIDAVKSGALRRIFLIGGCDGFEKERNYYTEFAEKVPADCLMLTLACGKFKVNMNDYGTLVGLPRLLDMGQCNDAYSAIRVAVALAEAFNTDVNSLPLSLILSWFEQKAVAILLTLLYLGIKNIYLGPRIPGFFTPTILNILKEKFSLQIVGNVDNDLRTILGTH
ncbi:hydroxylamine reductase [Pelomyxa schiedti]|nr:hydroxylamine reductase [Pelomyxa schiedti]